MNKLLIFFLLLFSISVDTIAQTRPTYPVSLTVAQDGSGNYKTIQEAVNAVRDLSQVEVKIFIKKGTYHEKLVIPSWKSNITLVGEDSAKTIITNSDYSGKPYPGKDVTGKDKFSTFTSYTVLVQGADFTAENLTIENRSGRVGQAVALHVEADRCTIKKCRLLGNQDTLYTANSFSRQYYSECFIEGTTDFIFGEATAVFNRCVVSSLSTSYITAASTSARQKYGYVFFDCRLVADTAVKRVALGRPWRPNAKTVFVNTEMGAHIAPAGWNNWSIPDNEKTAYYAEYNSTGPGGVANNRVKWSHQLTRKEVKEYTLENIFAGSGWIRSF